jgi:hypothetical protein
MHLEMLGREDENGKLRAVSQGQAWTRGQEETQGVELAPWAAESFSQVRAARAPFPRATPWTVLLGIHTGQRGMRTWRGHF